MGACAWRLFSNHSIGETTTPNPPEKRRSQGETSMNAAALGSSHRSSYQLRFQSLFQAGRGYAFPCDSCGRVDMDSLSDRARNNYFYARTVVGREFAVPAVMLND